MFRVKVPHLLLGYQEKDKTAKNSQINQQTYLNLHVTIEPNIPKLNPAIVTYHFTKYNLLKEYFSGRASLC